MELNEKNQLIKFRKPLWEKNFPFVLFWSQKSGCTTLVKWFFYQIGKLDEALAYHPWIHKYENEVFKKHLTYNEELIKAMNSREKTKIKLVRNPYKRAVSSFLMLSSPAVHKNKKHFAHREWVNIRSHFYDDPGSKQGICFYDYLKYLQCTGSRINENNPHFAQQYIDGEETYIDHYLQLEKYSEQIKDLEIRYNLKASDTDPRIIDSGHHRLKNTSSKENYSRMEINEKTFLSKKTPHYMNFYDEESSELARIIFYEDFKSYGYSECLGGE